MKDQFTGNYLRTGYPAGITYDDLDRDIETLVSTGWATEDELKAICQAIEDLSNSLDHLYTLSEKHLPHKNNGQNGNHPLNQAGQSFGRNRLLTMLMNIRDSHVSFKHGVTMIRKRTEKLLHQREQARISDNQSDMFKDAS